MKPAASVQCPMRRPLSSSKASDATSKLFNRTKSYQIGYKQCRYSWQTLEIAVKKRQKYGASRSALATISCLALSRSLQDLTSFRMASFIHISLISYIIPQIRAKSAFSSLYASIRVDRI
jgi:hypothetical protein